MDMMELHYQQPYWDKVELFGQGPSHCGPMDKAPASYNSTNAPVLSEEEIGVSRGLWVRVPSVVVLATNISYTGFVVSPQGQFSNFQMPVLGAIWRRWCNG